MFGGLIPALEQKFRMATPARDAKILRRQEQNRAHRPPFGWFEATV